jgi:hypothetical protein
MELWNWICGVDWWGTILPLFLLDLLIGFLVVMYEFWLGISSEFHHRKVQILEKLIELEKAKSMASQDSSTRKRKDVSHEGRKKPVQDRPPVFDAQWVGVGVGPWR